MEQNWGSWEGLTREEILARHGADAFVKAGSNQGEAFRPGGGESTGELHARVASFLKDVAQGEGDAVAVAHLGVLRAAYTLATGWDMATPMPAELDVSKILVLSLSKDGVPKIERLQSGLRSGPERLDLLELAIALQRLLADATAPGRHTSPPWRRRHSSRPPHRPCGFFPSAAPAPRCAHWRHH